MNPYEDLSDDDHIAFMQLEAEFRKNFEEAVEASSNGWDYYSSDYMNKTLAAAKALDIEALSAYSVPSTSSANFSETYSLFQKDVDNIIVQMRIMNARRRSSMSVGLKGDQKSKLHILIQKIRDGIEESDASIGKKERIFGILGKLAKEIDQARTHLERFADLGSALAGVSRDVAENGAEPWWKWYKVALGVVDEAKEAEPLLPAPAEKKQLEPPRKELPKPQGSYSDDEIPF